MVRRVLLFAALLFAAPLPALAQQGEVVVIVVRHAERAEDGTNDPPISTAGEHRAAVVAGMLANVPLTHVHSTDLRRTRSTAAPTVRATGLALDIYDPRDLDGFADRLRLSPGRHLVVGHSNTNPALVEALGGDPGPPIEEMEYDRGYVVVVLPDGSTGSAIFRFGGPAR